MDARSRRDLYFGISRICAISRYHSKLNESIVLDLYVIHQYIWHRNLCQTEERLCYDIFQIASHTTCFHIRRKVAEALKTTSHIEQVMQPIRAILLDCELPLMGSSDLTQYPGYFLSYVPTGAICQACIWFMKPLSEAIKQLSKRNHVVEQREGNCA
jgi:hypothetical protein